LHRNSYKRWEKNAVLAYLDRIAVFCIQPSDQYRKRTPFSGEKEKQLKQWKQTIRRGSIPENAAWK